MTTAPYEERVAPISDACAAAELPVDGQITGFTPPDVPVLELWQP